MRVATRRLRAFLRAGRKALDSSWAEGFATSSSGWPCPRSARDLDVLSEYLAAEVETLGEDAAAGRTLLEGLQDERAAARLAVVEALSSDRYLALLDRLDSGRNRR